MRTERRGALFIMAAPTMGDSGPVAVWITAANWARAASKIWGEAWIVTPEGIFGPEEALARASRPTLAPKQRARWRRYAPQVLITAAKDSRELVRARRFRRSLLSGRLDFVRPFFIWQHHDLFQTAGLRLARTMGCPLVQFVDAPQIWEDHRLGVRRPGWQGLLESAAERPQLLAADLVTCVTEEVAEAVHARGVPTDRIVVTPTGVDLESFDSEHSGDEVRARFGLESKFVVGWAGSFRPFHGLPLLMRAVAAAQERIPEIALLLVGDGQERFSMEKLAADVGIRTVVFTGTVPHAQMGDHIAAMDVAMLLDEGNLEFHYSPLKLREYMASGKPVIAARVGEVGRILNHEEDSLLVNSGDVEGAVSALERLFREPSLRQRIGSAARDRATREWSWGSQLDKVVAALGDRVTPSRKS